MKKIMFNDKYGLTKAVLSGSKTQTRIVTESLNAFIGTLGYDRFELKNTGDVWLWNDYENTFLEFKSKYKVGEVVAVAQSYENALIPEKVDCSSYSVTINHKDVWFGWEDKGYKNKMFVKADLMPHRIQITDIRLEKLQDISDECCLKEGIQFIADINKYYFECPYKDEGFYFDTPRVAYAELIDKISGKGTWLKNPYVFVYDFKLIK